MKIKTLAFQGICSAIFAGLCVAPVWSDTPGGVPAGDDHSGEAVKPAKTQALEDDLSSAQETKVDLVVSEPEVNAPAVNGERPSTLDDRRAARRQTATRAVSEPTCFVNNYVEENLANPTIGVPTEGQVYQELSADLNHDQHLERVTLIPFATSEQGDIYMQLTVFNDKDEIIYQSPRVTDCENVKTFALYNAGECALQLLYDLDGDGNFELLESLPRSDVRPKPYRLWRWDGDKFIFLKDFTFQASPKNNEMFVLDDSRWDGVENIAWLENIAVRGGQLKADVMSWKPYGIAQGKAVLEPNGYRGLKVVRWEKHILDIQL